jgi:hypothetical protein
MEPKNIRTTESRKRKNYMVRATEYLEIRKNQSRVQSAEENRKQNGRKQQPETVNLEL